MPSSCSMRQVIRSSWRLQHTKQLDRGVEGSSETLARYVERPRFRPGGILHPRAGQQDRKRKLGGPNVCVDPRRLAPAVPEHLVAADSSPRLRAVLERCEDGPRRPALRGVQPRQSGAAGRLLQVVGKADLEAILYVTVTSFANDAGARPAAWCW